MIKQLAVSFLVLAIISSCSYFTGERIRGNGNVVTETRTPGSFNSVDVSGAIDVYIKQDASSSVSVETDENIQPYIITEVNGNTLRIKQENNTSLRTTRLKVYVSAPQFVRLEASGACKIYSENKITSTEKLDIHLSGASHAKIDLSSPEVEAGLSGAGSVELTGQTKDLDVHGSGSSKIRCFDLMAENVDVSISGAGNAEVYASAKLDVGVSGSGDIKYKGDPSVSQHISGAGSVRKAE